jgi:hypothetical protein
MALSWVYVKIIGSDDALGRVMIFHGDVGLIQPRRGNETIDEVGYIRVVVLYCMTIYNLEGPS